MFVQLILLAASCGFASAQTFQRLGGCPTLGCILPPDQTDFLAGQYFDIRLEVHAPVNGSEAVRNTVPDPNFTFTVEKNDKRNGDRNGRNSQNATAFFKVSEPKLETWNFTWYEDLFAQAASKPSVVNVASKAYRRVALYEPGEYTATLKYNNGTNTTATWLVRDIAEKRKTKNILLFIGDGMTTNMITAARLIAHKTVNGRYQSKMALDKFPVLGHQMTHSLDSFITDSANSATALYSGHKSTVNALGTYVDSSKDAFDDPKVESIAEIFYRLTKGGVGIVSTAFLADATPAALTAHTRDRNQYAPVVDSFLNGVTANWTWTNWTGPDVLFGGGAEQFYPNSRSYKGQDYYQLYGARNYSVVYDKTQLAAASNSSKALGVFCISNMAKWLDRNVYTGNLKGQKNDPRGNGTDALDQPGLKEMTLKAIDILNARHSSDGWFLMSEAASIDKMMHVLDYDRALGELLELDDTVKASIAKLSALNTLKETLVLVTADHGHGFDVMGSVDTKYLAAQADAGKTDRAKRDAIGTYRESGQSQYVLPGTSSSNSSALLYSEGIHFPMTWDPRYALYAGVTANPDRKENYTVHKYGPRVPAVNISSNTQDYYASPKDAPNGILVNGTLPVSADQGVHSLTDVPVFAQGPCQEDFGGVYNNIDIFFAMAGCLGLSRPK